MAKVDQSPLNDFLRILLVEDSDDDAELVLRFARRAAATVESVRVQTEKEMREALADGIWHLVISDFNLPSFSGADAIRILASFSPDIPLVLVSGTIGEDVAVEALKMGATDYVLKSNLGRLPSAINRCLREARAREEHRRTSEQLVHAQKMEAVGRLASGVAHDVNNILTVITLQSETAIDQLENGNLQAARQSLADIRLAQESATRIVRQLLLFGRRQTASVAVVDFATAIREVEPLIKRLAGSSVKVELDYPNEAIPVIADLSQIEQIALNMTVNARDAMPSGGKLRFSLEVRTFTEAPRGLILSMNPGAYAVLTITDSGCGIPPEIRPRIFEPFFTTKEVGKGTGLGLSVIYGILRDSGGSLGVESEVGKGTTFRIYWPIAETDEETVGSSAKVSRTSTTTGPFRILLVEDEPILREPIAAALRSQGHTVWEAENGEAGLKVVEAHGKEIDLLITDVTMPVLNGTTLLTKAREIRKDLKAILMTGYAGDLLQDVVVDGSTRFLEKPFERKDLLREIGEILKTS